jgi:hypothetical protein
MPIDLQNITTKRADSSAFRVLDNEKSRHFRLDFSFLFMLFDFQQQLIDLLTISVD